MKLILYRVEDGEPVHVDMDDAVHPPAEEGEPVHVDMMDVEADEKITVPSSH